MVLWDRLQRHCHLTGMASVLIRATMDATLHLHLSLSQKAVMLMKGTAETEGNGSIFFFNDKYLLERRKERDHAEVWGCRNDCQMVSDSLGSDSLVLLSKCVIGCFIVAPFILKTLALLQFCIWAKVSCACYHLLKNLRWCSKFKRLLSLAGSAGFQSISGEKYGINISYYTLCCLFQWLLDAQMQS